MKSMLTLPLPKSPSPSYAPFPKLTMQPQPNLLVAAPGTLADVEAMLNLERSEVLDVFDLQT